MSELRKNTLSWVFILLAVSAAAVLLSGTLPVGASDDHESVRELRERGDIMPLAQLLEHAELRGLRVLEAELEYEDGRLVYELELLDRQGRVRERYFDAVSGLPLSAARED
jgi:uncharacterized membrane protein YkoI